MWQEYRLLTIAVIVMSVPLTIVIPFFPILSFGALCAFLFFKAHKKFMQEFARANSLEYAESAGIESVSGRLFSKGHSKKISNVVSGQYKEHPLRLFNYRYTVGSGKNSHTYTFTACEICFEKTDFPHILLHSKTMWGRLGSVDMWGSDKDMQISLEDEFKKDFSLYVTQDYEIEALQIFTSEVLSFLQKEAKDFSIEFAGNRVYIYDNKVIYTSKELHNMYQVVQKIFDTVGGMANRLHDDFDSLHGVYRKGK